MNPMEGNHTEEMRNKLYLDNFYVKMDGKYIKKPVNEELEKMLTNVDMEQRINMPFTTEIGYTVEEGDTISAEEIAEERVCKRFEKYNAEDTFIEFDNGDEDDGDEFDLLNIEMPKICSSDIEFSESEFDVSAVARSISLERKSEVSEEDYSRNSGFDDILNSNDNDESVNSIVIKNSDRTKHKTISSTPKKRDNQDTPSKSSDICENNEIKNSQLLDELIITNENEGKSLDNINLDDFNSIYKSFFTSRGEKPTLSSNGRFI